MEVVEESDSHVIPLDIYMQMMYDLEGLRIFVQESLKEIVDNGDLPQMRKYLKEGLLFLLSMHKASIEKIRAQQIIWWFYWGDVESKCWSELSDKDIRVGHAISIILLHGFKRLYKCVYGILNELNEAKYCIEWRDTLALKMNHLASNQEDLEFVFGCGKYFFYDLKMRLNSDDEPNKELHKVRRDARRLKKEADYANNFASESKKKLENERLEHKKETIALKKKHGLEVEELKGKLKRLEEDRRDEMEKLKTHLRDLNKLHENATIELRRKDIEVNRLTQEVKDLQLLNSQLLTSNSCLEAKKTSSEKKIGKLEKKNAKLQTQLELPSNLILGYNDTLEERIVTLESQLKEQEDYLTEQVMREDEIELLTKKYKCLISDIGSIHQAENKIRNKELTRKRKLCLDMQEQMASLKMDKYELNSYIKSLEAKNKLLTDSSQDLERRIQKAFSR